MKATINEEQEQLKATKVEGSTKDIKEILSKIDSKHPYWISHEVYDILKAQMDTKDFNRFLRTKEEHKKNTRRSGSPSSPPWINQQNLDLKINSSI